MKKVLFLSFVVFAIIFNSSATALAGYPVTSSADLGSGVRATTTVSLGSKGQVANVVFVTSTGNNVGSIELTSDKPSVRNVNFKIGKAELFISRIQFSSASPTNKGAVIATGTIRPNKKPKVKFTSFELANWA